MCPGYLNLVGILKLHTHAHTHTHTNSKKIFFDDKFHTPEEKKKS